MAVPSLDPFSRGAGASSDSTLRVILSSDSPVQVTADVSTLATSAKQDTGNTSLASIDTKFPAKGAAATSASTPVNIASDQTVPVSLTPATSGGLSISRTLSANNTTGINAKNAAGQVYGWSITNTNASERFVKLYNKASAPAVGTDTPVITIVVPAAGNGGVNNASFPTGIAFGTGVGYGITTGIADNDTGAPAANEVVVALLYK